LSATPRQDGDATADGRRLDRRTFLRSAAVGGAGLAAGVLPGGALGASARAWAIPASMVSTPRKGGTLKVGLTGGSSTDNLNPYIGGFTAIGTARNQQIYQPLVQLANNAQPQYVLAEEIVPRGSTSTWIIRLRKGVMFHNGKPFGADDVVSFLRASLNPKTGLTGGLVLTPVDLKGLRKLDSHTVEVPMKVPFGSFLEQLAALWWVMYVPPAGWKKGDKAIGTGPFMYKSFTPGQQSVFVHNPNYWKSGRPYLDSVVISDFSDANALQNALTSKAIDATGFLTGTQAKILQHTPGIKTVVSKTGAIAPFTMRVDKAPFNNVNVRQAFRYLIDRQQMIDTTLSGYGWVAADVTSPWDVDYNRSLHRDQDVDLAKHLLKKAGHDNNLTVTLDTSLAIQAYAPLMATIFKQQAKAVGVTVNINQISASDYFGPNVYLKVPFAQIYYNYSPYLSQVAQTFLPTSPWPETHFTSPRYGKLYLEANKTANAALRREIEHEMQHIDFTEGGYIVPFFVDSIDAYSTKLTGFVEGKVGEAMGNFNFEDYHF
jgi:peptide/nickel transport system substrate-binding protein